MPYRKYYHLERYLFDEVGPRYRKTGRLAPVDLYFVLIWKASRVKNTAQQRLARKAGTFKKAARAIARSVGKQTNDEQRLQILMEVWGFRLPTATALLSVLYPDRFTVYDERVRSQLGFDKIGAWRFSPKLWNRYREFVCAVKSGVATRMSLREKDRYLWGKSLYQGARKALTRPVPRVATRREKDSMKKAKQTKSDDLRPGYNREDFPKDFVRGKYASRFPKESMPKRSTGRSTAPRRGTL